MLFWVCFDCWNCVVTTGGMSGGVYVHIRAKCVLPKQTVRVIWCINAFYERKKWCFQPHINFQPMELVMHVIYVGSRCAFKGKPSLATFVPVEVCNTLGVTAPGSVRPVWSDEVLKKSNFWLQICSSPSFAPVHQYVLTMIIYSLRLPPESLFPVLAQRQHCSVPDSAGV